jgi:hypothetical protein
MQRELELFYVRVTDGTRAHYYLGQHLDHVKQIWLLGYYLDAAAATNNGELVAIHLHGSNMNISCANIATTSASGNHGPRAVVVPATAAGYVDLQTPILVASFNSSEKLGSFDVEVKNHTTGVVQTQAAAGAGRAICVLKMGVVKNPPLGLPSRLSTWQSDAGSVFREW